MKHSYESIKTVSSLVDALNNIDVDTATPEMCAHYAVKLSLLQFNLAPLVNRSKLTFNSTYLFRKVKGAQLYFQMQGTGKDKEELIKKETQSVYEDEIYYNYEFESLEALYDNINRLISVLQTYSRHLQAQQMSSNVQPG